MRLHRRPPALAAAVAAALALTTGCTSDAPAESAAAASPSPSEPPPASLVREAAFVTDDAATSRYSLTTATTVNGAEVVFKGEGIYDWGKDNGQTTYDTPVGTVRQRLVGPDLFLNLPQQPTVFFKLKTADVANSPVGGTVDPTAQLHALAAVSEAEVVGEEDVRGEQTTHYRGAYDVTRALRGARGLQQAALRSSLGPAAAAVTSAPYDVFLDDAGRLRRLTQTIDVPSGGQTLTVTTTLELYDFGIPVRVMSPPGANQRDGAPLLAALRKALPAPAPAAAPRVSPSPSASP